MIFLTFAIFDISDVAASKYILYPRTSLGPAITVVIVVIRKKRSSANRASIFQRSSVETSSILKLYRL